MPNVQETVYEVSVTSVVLREIAGALRAYIQPLEEMDEMFRSTAEREYGPLGITITNNSYSRGGRVVADFEATSYDDASLDSWPPSECDGHQTTFHVRRHTPGSRYSNTSMYVRITASSWGSAEVLVFADEGDFAIRMMDTVMEILKSHPQPAEADSGSKVTSIFIGHGGDRKWEAVRDYLAVEGNNVSAFESEERASYLTLDVVAQMIRSANIAVIVLTGVDQMADGKRHARQNVVHELGFAQGALGIENTIVLLEDGTEEFTNIAGLTQIRFAQGEIHTTRDRVLRVIAERANAPMSCGI